MRRSTRPLHVTVIDPAERLGRGMACRSTDSDRRLNAPTFAHSLLPDDAWHLSHWVRRERLLEQNPQALRPDGGVFLRRGDIGRYLEQTLQRHSHRPASGPRITCVRDLALGLSAPDAPLRVATHGGLSLRCDLLFIATGNPPPRLPPPFNPALAAHPGVIEHPLAATRLEGIDAQARSLARTRRQQRSRRRRRLRPLNLNVCPPDPAPAAG
ncbi:MAG: FAD/NAD(P)-binding protein [Ideonella sp.]|nr:FAD/NAD(P)-binding protein [Ideonella sp.]